jgi:ribosomal protein S18 acetylase RimI-like enzyme
VRPATVEDLPRLGEMGEALARMHHEFDAQRFLWGEDFARGYAWWFGKELANSEAYIAVIEGDGGRLDGYVYGRLEERDWNELLDAHAALVDVYVRPEARRHGIGEALLQAFLAWAKGCGAPRVVLSTATQNAGAQKLFQRLGFRATMVEMTRESE